MSREFETLGASKQTPPVERERQRPTDIAASERASFAHRRVYVSRSAGRKEGRKQKKERRKLFREKLSSLSD